jgi:hypothetical protein
VTTKTYDLPWLIQYEHETTNRDTNFGLRTVPMNESLYSTESFKKSYVFILVLLFYLVDKKIKQSFIK